MIGAADATSAVPGSVHGDAAGKFALIIVGIGSDFRGDDMVGLKVLGLLKGNVPAGVAAVELTGDQSHLLELMRSTDAMIIVDAVQSSAPAGTIFRIDASREPVPRDLVTFSTHAVDSITAVELARALGALPKTVVIYGIVGKDFTFSGKLSAETAEATEIIQERILKEVADIMAEQSRVES